MGGIKARGIGTRLDGHRCTRSTGAETGLVGYLCDGMDVRTQGKCNERGETYDSDELGIRGESEWKRYGGAVVREGLVDDLPDLYIILSRGRANGDDQEFVWGRALAIDSEREVLTLCGDAGEFEGICVGERGEEDGN